MRFTDAHHIEHWADGGETSLRNMVLLCRQHHRLVHEDGHRAFSDADGQVVFFTPHGQAIAASPPMPGLGRDPAEELMRRNRERGVTIDWRSGRPEYRGEAEIPIERTVEALKALDRAAAGAESAEAA